MRVPFDCKKKNNMEIKDVLFTYNTLRDKTHFDLVFRKIIYKEKRETEREKEGEREGGREGKKELREGGRKG